VAGEQAGSPRCHNDSGCSGPYAVSFAWRTAVFILETLHIDVWQRRADRVPELGEIAEWLADWAKRGDVWGTNLIAPGDFNIDRKDDLPLPGVHLHRVAATSKPQLRPTDDLR
jgi:hypothetical protein